jgi:hypothetical protein
MATDLNPPITFGAEKSVLGHAHLYAGMQIWLELQDALNALDLGVVPLVGEFAGSGTDTMRVTHMGNVGFSIAMDAMASETDTITPKKITAGYSSISIGQYGLGHAETYKHALLGREEMTKLDALKALIPASWLRTFRDLWCTTGASITTAIGSASTELSIDDWIDLATAYEESLGAGSRGAPTVCVSPQQITQSKASARTEPAFQNSLSDFTGVQAVNFGQVFENFLGLGFRTVKTDSITQSGGAYQGFSHSPGGIGWGRVSTAGLKTANPQGTMLIPDYGLVIEEDPNGNQARRKAEARSWIGMALGDQTDGIHVQRRLISKV